MLGITVLGSGSSGNALVLHAGEVALLLDAGFSAREFTRRCAAADVDPGQICAIIVSHEHRDHIAGLGPVARRLGVPVYCNRLTGEAIRQGLPRPPAKLHLFASGNPFSINGIEIEPFSIPHDAIDPVAFVFRCQGLKVGIATDLGYASQLTQHRLLGCDALIIESNHDIAMLRESRRPWALKQRIMSRHGHLSNDASMELVGKVVNERTRCLILAHASQECNRYELVEQQAARRLAEMERTNISSHVARQDEPLPTLWL
ncbi:MAG: MBL fold metallo-hydrolase [Kiritimatiellaeota bacterium]|nr:MBL fold metallo-hydrolase [Kiritimatiellota bacterium]